MGIRSLRTASISTGVKRSKVWDQSAVVVTNSYESIATQVVGAGGAASITFSSIPGTYKHLQIRTFARTPSNTLAVFQVNGDNGNNYAIHRINGNGSTVVANNTVSYNYGGVSLTPSASDIFSAGIIDILDYANTSKTKVFKTLSGWDANGSGQVEMRSSLWNSTSAITSLVFTTDSGGSFQQYTHFALYGIKG
jgi:hypothetical protein